MRARLSSRPVQGHVDDAAIMAVTTVTDEQAGKPLPEKTVEMLTERMRRELQQPGDAGYDAARRIWNGMIDKHPALILRCTGVKDVSEGVNFARANDLLLAVRSGGRNVAGTLAIWRSRLCAHGGAVLSVVGLSEVRGSRNLYEVVGIRAPLRGKNSRTGRSRPASERTMNTIWWTCSVPGGNPPTRCTVQKTG